MSNFSGDSLREICSGLLKIQPLCHPMKATTTSPTTNSSHLQVTNFPKFLRDIELYGKSDMTKMVERVIDFPEDLADFFDKNPEVSQNRRDKETLTVVDRFARITWSSRRPPTHR